MIPFTRPAASLRSAMLHSLIAPSIITALFGVAMILGTWAAGMAPGEHSQWTFTTLTH